MEGQVFTPTTQLKRPFIAAKRLDISQFESDEALSTFIEEHCVNLGKPLVLTNLNSLPGWDRDLFDLERTLQIYGEKDIQVQGPMAKKSLHMAAYVDMLKKEGKMASSGQSITSPLAESASELSTRPTISPKPSSSQPKSESKRTSIDDTPSAEIDVPALSVNDDKHDVTNGFDNKEHRPISPTDTQQDVSTPTTTISNPTEMMPVYTGIGERVQTGTRRRKCNTGVSSSPLKKPRYDTSLHDISDESDDENDEGGTDGDEQQQNDKEKYYAKDIDTPDEYEECLPNILPPCLLPLGSSDLIRTLPSSLQAVNLMCYLGGDRTGTALHRDISGAIGHNIMTFAVDGAYAQWLVIDKGDTNKLRELCQEDFGDGVDKRFQQHGQTKKSYFLECECAWVSPKQLEARGINTHVILQQPGDMVIIPSLCYHQVTNVGISFKMAWNRVTAHSLLEGIKIQLPLYNMISRPELYRCKATVYFALKDILADMPTPITLPSKPQQDAFLKNCRALLHLFAKDVILPEIIEPIAIENVSNNGIIQDGSPGDGEIGFDVVCDFCYGDIFHRYYNCRKCEMDLCLQCYVVGRSCAHIDELCMHEPSSLDLRNDESPQDDMNVYILLYENIVYQLNRTFGPLSIIPEFTSFKHRGDCYSLATTCRRIEMYRKNNKYLSNKIHCSHCERIFDIWDTRRDIKTIFQQRPCYNSLSYSLNSTVFVCFRCAKKCVSCSSLNGVTRLDTELVYFRDMTKDIELWGGFVDKGMFQSAYWPEYKVKSNNGDRKTLAKIEERSWSYPEDFMQLAAVELIKNITPEGWKCWAKNESVGKNNISIADLVYVLAQKWTDGYKKIQGCTTTLSNTKIYSYKQAAIRKSADDSNYDKYITTADLAFSIPESLLLEEIVENRGRPRKYPRQDDEWQAPRRSRKITK
ncbi:unnamed protein product [Absidia cylindrospora]